MTSIGISRGDVNVPDGLGGSEPQLNGPVLGEHIASVTHLHCRRWPNGEVAVYRVVEPTVTALQITHDTWTGRLIRGWLPPSRFTIFGDAGCTVIVDHATRTQIELRPAEWLVVTTTGRLIAFDHESFTAMFEREAASP